MDRVRRLLDAERRERVHMEAMREREEWEKAEREWAAREKEREKREKEEREKARRREAYRPTVESASDSSEEDIAMSARGNPQDGSEAIIESMDDAEGNGTTRPPSETPPSESDFIVVDADEEPVQAQPKAVPAPRDPSPPRNAKPSQERNGLCVVCQDEESNIVIVDCGYVSLGVKLILHRG